MLLTQQIKILICIINAAHVQEEEVYIVHGLCGSGVLPAARGTGNKRISWGTTGWLVGLLSISPIKEQ